MRALMDAAAEGITALTFGIDRGAMGTIEIRATGIYLRELRKMTAEEVESAIVGFKSNAWEQWPDEAPTVVGDPNVPDGRAYITGLSGWLP